jgi:hypothetical protein
MAYKFFPLKLACVYEKREEEKPVSIIVDNSEPNRVCVKVKSWYDDFTYLTENCGKSWWKK